MIQLLLIFTLFSSPDSATHRSHESPLASYSVQWNDTQYVACNTVANVKYMSEQEKMVIYILNLARKNPPLFCETVLKAYPGKKTEMEHYETSSYYKSLINGLTIQQPLGLLKPDSLSYQSAYCHAFRSGESGYVGHDRTPECQKKAHYTGECCGYGLTDPLDIVIDLLIDEDVESLGHRQICLDDRYTKLGVSIQPHKEYGYNVVLDFN